MRRPGKTGAIVVLSCAPLVLGHGDAPEGRWWIGNRGAEAEMRFTDHDLAGLEPERFARQVLSGIQLSDRDGTVCPLEQDAIDRRPGGISVRASFECPRAALLGLGYELRLGFVGKHPVVATVEGPDGAVFTHVFSNGGALRSGEIGSNEAGSGFRISPLSALAGFAIALLAGGLVPLGLFSLLALGGAAVFGFAVPALVGAAGLPAASLHAVPWLGPLVVGGLGVWLAARPRPLPRLGLGLAALGVGSVLGQEASASWLGAALSFSAGLAWAQVSTRLDTPARVRRVGGAALAASAILLALV